MNIDLWFIFLKRKFLFLLGRNYLNIKFKGNMIEEMIFGYVVEVEWGVLY